MESPRARDENDHVTHDGCNGNGAMGAIGGVLLTGITGDVSDMSYRSSVGGRRNEQSDYGGQAGIGGGQRSFTNW